MNFISKGLIKGHIILMAELGESQQILFNVRTDYTLVGNGLYLLTEWAIQMY